MNKTLLIALSLSLSAGTMMAQSAVDAYSISRGGDLRGTARFMSMGGAFTALGGDISTLNQNPGGIGLYRSSDLSLTLDLEPQSITSSDGGSDLKTSQTKFNVNNFRIYRSCQYRQRDNAILQLGCKLLARGFV